MLREKYSGKNKQQLDVAVLMSISTITKVHIWVILTF